MEMAAIEENAKQRRKWCRGWVCAYRRQPWEQSNVGWAQRSIHTGLRWVLYVLSLLIIVTVVGACCVFVFDAPRWSELRAWADDSGFSLAKYLYFIYAVFLLTVIMHFWGTFAKAKFLPRIQDRPYVRWFLDKGKLALAGMEKDESASGCKRRRNQVLMPELRTAVEELENNLREDRGVVEYDLLHLKTLLVDCASKERIKAQADLYLNDLEDLADEETHTQTKEDYWDIRYQIESLKEKLGSHNDSLESEQVEPSAVGHHAEKRRCAGALRELRAVVTERLLPTVIENEKLWVEGSAMVNMLRYACIWAIPLLLAAGTVPGYVVPSSDGDAPLSLTALNWAILGVAGALVAVLRALGRADRLEVGNQLGSREIQRTWRGAGLGLVAGFLTYMLVASNFVSCYLFENCDLSANGTHHRYVLLAFLAGYAFERTLDRVRAAAGN